MRRSGDIANSLRRGESPTRKGAGETTLPGMRPSRRFTASLALVWTAGLAGLVHAAFSLYWALGGGWLLATVGQWAVDLAAEAPLAAGLALGLVAAAKLLGATIPIGVAYGRVPRPRFWRGISWVGGLVLTVYGAVNTIVAVAVLAEVIQPEGGYDADAMMGHAYLWDPLFLLWGAALLLSLWFSRRSSPGIRHHHLGDTRPARA